MTVLFYISGHGFGHASRQVEVINALGARRPDLAIEIRSAVKADLLARTVRGPYRLVPTATDTGIVQRDSVTHDDPATLAAAREFYGTYAGRVAHEVATLPADLALIVGDVPALAFDVAAAGGVASLAIANFTWDWIYETHAGFDDASWVVSLIRAAYRRATSALELPFSGGFEVFGHRQSIPLITRRPSVARADTRFALGLPAERPLALLSFGGYGLPALDLARLDCRDRWTIVTTDRVSADVSGLSHVIKLDETVFRGGPVRYEDLVAAADVVVTKPGYGILAECLASQTAMLYTSRGDFREYDVLVRELPRYVRSRFISQDDLFAGRWTESLEALHRQPPAPERMALDGAEQAAGIIVDLLGD